MLVSIIIPCYNAGKFLSATLDSVLYQTHKDWECIIIDDHSSDNSHQIAEKYCNEYPNKFFFLSSPRKGACAARNEGLRVAKGEYIQFLDADDLLSETKLEYQLKALIDQDSKTVANCAYSTFLHRKEDSKLQHQAINKSFDEPYKWLIQSWQGKGMSQTATWLIHHDLISIVGFWDEELLINQDGEFFCRVLLNAKRIQFVENCRVYYRQSNPKSISKQKSYEVFLSQLNSYLKYTRHIKQLDLKKQELVLPALGAQLSDYYIRMKHAHPTLAIQALDELKKLNLNLTPQGGRMFRTISTIIGIDNAIIIRSLLSSKK
jgi:glycosyltransferase involved in cell wall biosynthesis